MSTPNSKLPVELDLPRPIGTRSGAQRQWAGGFFSASGSRAAVLPLIGEKPVAPPTWEEESDTKTGKGQDWSGWSRLPTGSGLLAPLE